MTKRYDFVNLLAMNYLICYEITINYLICSVKSLLLKVLSRFLFKMLNQIYSLKFYKMYLNRISLNQLTLSNSQDYQTKP